MSISPASSEVGSRIVFSGGRRTSSSGGHAGGGAASFPPLPAVARQNPFSVSSSATPKSRYSWPRKQKKAGSHDEPDRADLGKQSFGLFVEIFYMSMKNRFFFCWGYLLSSLLMQ
jgi:hypothetical protein